MSKPAPNSSPRCARRLRLAEQLYWSARKMKAAGLRSQHPDWPEQHLTEEVRRIFSHAEEC
jgi:hypothetical protein